tara:strand:+ start:418 stop:573 length:156 start_codon:yes stop_codon:yes gene_type:complete
MITHVTIKKAAERFSFHPDTIRRAIKKKDLKAVKIGGSIRIPVKSLEQWGS